MMTMKHFKFIARHINAERERMAENSTGHAPEIAFHTLQQMALAMCAEFEADNPNFKRRLFLDACGMKGTS